MALEDLSAYSATDPGGDFDTATVNTKNDITSMARNVSSWLSKDFGVDFFDATWSIDFTIYVDSAGDAGCHFGLVNTPHDEQWVRDNSGDELELYVQYIGGVPKFILSKIDSGAVSSDGSFEISEDTEYFCRFYKTVAGTFGTIHADIYTSDANRTAETSAIVNFDKALTKDMPMRYLLATQNRNVSGAEAFTGYIKDVTITVPVETIIPIPKATFDFTGKVPTVLVSAITTVAIPKATFNFTRYPLTVRNTDVGIPIPKATFDFTGKVLTVDLTGNNVIAIPKKSFNFSTKVLSVLVTNSEEEISWSLFDVNGDAITGASPTLKIRARSTGFLLDWSDMVFKLGGGSSPTTIMPELDAVDFPGFYAKTIELGSWDDDWYIASLAYSATPNQNSSLEFLVQGGLRSSDQNSANLDVTVSSRASATKQDDMKDQTDFIEKWILNRLVVEDTQITLYDDDNTTPLKTWPWTDATNNRGKAT